MEFLRALESILPVGGLVLAWISSQERFDAIKVVDGIAVELTKDKESMPHSNVLQSCRPRPNTLLLWRMLHDYHALQVSLGTLTRRR